MVDQGEREPLRPEVQPVSLATADGVAPVQAAKFHILRGEEYLKEFRASPNKARVFCAECGSPLYSAKDDLPGIKRLRLGTLETPVQAKRQYHAFVAEKASWYEIRDGFAQHPGRAT